MAQFFHGLGRLRLEKGDFRGAEDALAQAVAIRSQALSPNDPDTIRALPSSPTRSNAWAGSATRRASTNRPMTRA